MVKPTAAKKVAAKGRRSEARDKEIGSQGPSQSRKGHHRARASARHEEAHRVEESARGEARRAPPVLAPVTEVVQAPEPPVSYPRSAGRLMKPLSESLTTRELTTEGGSSWPRRPPGGQAGHSLGRGSRSGRKG